MDFISHICGLGASVGCERVERTFNAPRLKAQIWLMKFTGFVCSSLNELNSTISFWGAAGKEEKWIYHKIQIAKSKDLRYNKNQYVGAVLFNFWKENKDCNSKYRISYLFSGCLWLDFDWIKIVVVGIWGKGQKFSTCSQNIVNRYFFILLLHIGRSNHTLYSQSFSSKQKTSASLPKSPYPV